MVALQTLLQKVLLVGLLAGCARESGEVRAPASSSAAGWVRPATEYSFPPRTLSAGRGPAPPVPALSLSPLRFAALPGVPVYADGRPRPLAPELIAAEIPAGDGCLQELRRAGVSFEALPEKRGVDTPVAITGPIGQVRYESAGASEMVADCRLALGLVKIAPELASLEITGVRFSGAYSYRMSRVGRLSLHAYGLALDIHEVTAAGKSHSVKRDFARGLPNGCKSDAPLLNRLACRFAQLRLFQEFLTPDSNADHRDHLHVAIARVPRD